MKKAFYIVQVDQKGIFSQIKKVENQPKEGFENESQAKKHMDELIKIHDWVFCKGWYDFAIMELYRRIEK